MPSIAAPMRTSRPRTMRGAVWLEPRLQAEVTYAEITGGRLRAPICRLAGDRSLARFPRCLV